MLKPRVLIADNDETFLQLLQSEKSQVEVTTTTDLRSTQLAISDVNVRYSAICLSTSLCDPMGIPLVKHAKTYRPSTALYLLYSADQATLNGGDLTGLHIQSEIKKPVSSHTLLQILVPASYFNLADALEVGRTDATKAGESCEADNGQMHAIDARSFLCGQKSFFDLFVKIADKKYVMLLKAGDAFEPERLLTYLKRGVTSFYIRKEAQLYYLQYCDKITSAVLDSSSVSNETKINQVMNLGAETFAFLRNAGVSETSLSVAQGFVKHANQLVKKGGLTKQSDVEAFLKNAALADHGTSVVILTSMMTKALGFTDEKVTGVIATGALLHDIGMLSLPESLQKKAEADPDSLSPEEQAQYERHPTLGAEILLKVPHINPIIPQIASQHHERRTRKGFPNKLGSGAISPAAEMVGLAETFLLLAKRPDQGPPLEQLKKYHGDDFTLKLMDSFISAFRG